jgi:uncharacterized protein
VAGTTTRGGMTLEQLRRRREDILRIAVDQGASNVRIFGSVARGRVDSSSDVDILVDITTNVDGFAYFRVIEELRRALENLLGCKVDIIELRGPFSPRGQRMAERIRQESIPL